MRFPDGQAARYKILRSVLGTRFYSLAKASKLAFPVNRSSYSQSGEDTALLSYFDSSVGTYLDIGSGHPIHLSNTYLLYRLGWRGICVDPIGTNHFLAKIVRPGDMNVRALVSNEPGPVEFFEMDPSFYSTTDRTIATNLQNGGAALIRQQKLPAIPVSSLPFKPKSAEPSVMSIDVEGYELSVLQSVDWEAQLPSIVLVEMWNRDDRFMQNRKVHELMLDVGYQNFSTTGADNVMYIRKDLV